MTGLLFILHFGMTSVKRAPPVIVKKTGPEKSLGSGGLIGALFRGVAADRLDGLHAQPLLTLGGPWGIASQPSRQVGHVGNHGASYDPYPGRGLRLEVADDSEVVSITRTPSAVGSMR
jgi:hypothetical protein